MKDAADNERVRRFSSLGEDSHSLVALLDAEGRVLYLSPSFETMLGYKPHEHLGENVFAHVHPDDAPAVGAAFEAVVGSRLTEPIIQFRIRHVDGSWRHVEAVSINRLSDPSVRGMVVHARDVTEREKAETKLRIAERRYRTLVERVPAIIYTQEMRPGGTASYEVSYMSPRVEEVLGFPARAFVEDRDFWDTLVHPEDIAEVAAEDERTDLTGEPFLMEYRMFHRDGSVVWVRDEAVLVWNEEDESTYWQGVITDVTEQKYVEEALRQSEEYHRRQVRQLSLLHWVRTALACELEVPKLLKTVVEAIAQTYGYVQVSAYLLEGTPGDGVLVLQHQVGYRTVIERIPVTQGVSGRAVRTGESILLEDVRGDPAFLGAIGGITSEVCVPLFDEGTVIGFLNVESTGGRTLTADDLALVEEVGAHAGTAVSRARLHSRVRKSEERYRTLVELSPEPIAVHDGERLLYINPAGSRLFGARHPDELLGRKVLDFVHPDQRRIVTDRVNRALQTGEPTPLIEETYLAIDGNVLELEVAGQPITYAERPALQVVLRDVMERKALERRLAYQALHDPLTGLANRRLFDDRLEHALDRARRSGGRVVLLYLDLDGFKEVNDALGHEAGDELLGKVARRLRGFLRDSDTAARVGGDEFCVLLEDESESEAGRVAGRIVEELRAPFELGTDEAKISASVGIATSHGGSREDEQSPRELLRKADLAMYQAKRGGKDRCEAFNAGISARELGLR